MSARRQFVVNRGVAAQSVEKWNDSTMYKGVLLRQVLPGATFPIRAQQPSGRGWRNRDTERGMRQVADQAKALGRYEAVIHNAGVGYREPRRTETADGLSLVFAVNVLAPYVLTALMTPPDRLVYLSSGMHRGGDPDLSDLQWARRQWNGSQAYADSKLFDVVLAFAVARHWPHVLSNALEPGWVPTKMGGPGAPDDMDLAPVTQVWLATSADPEAMVTGRYFYHQRLRDTNPATGSLEVQEGLPAKCATLTKVVLQ